MVCASSYSGSSYLGLFDFAMFPIGCSLTGYFDFTRIYIVMPKQNVSDLFVSKHAVMVTFNIVLC